MNGKGRAQVKTSRKKLPIGIENFVELQTEEFYYVDKTGLIRNLLSHWAKVNLFTRPRRFGKSLNMSMLKTFFELGTDKSLFQNFCSRGHGWCSVPLHQQMVGW